MLHSSVPRGRRQARPKKRWDQDFVDYVEKVFPQQGKHWQDFATDAQWWQNESENFAKE